MSDHFKERNKDFSKGQVAAQYAYIEAEREVSALRSCIRDMYRMMGISCQFGHPIPAGSMAHLKNVLTGWGIEVDA